LKKLRVFLALELMRSVRKQISAFVERITPQVDGVKWVGCDYLHLTLKFFGEVDELDIPEICQSVKRSVAGHPPIKVRCLGVGAFPSLSRARTIWVGVSEASADSVIVLQSNVDADLNEIGFRSENRRFQPHVTLGRVRDGQHRQRIHDLLVEQSDTDFGSSLVESVTLFSSELTKVGPEYTVLARFPL